MTQMYLAQKLDPLPSTDLIRKIRKDVYHEIETIDDAFGFMPKDEEDRTDSLMDQLDDAGVGESVGNDQGKENTVVGGVADTVVSSDGVARVQLAATNGLPWTCKICSKKNQGTTNKCIVCGRLQSSGPIKTSKFMSLKVKGEKGLPSSSTLSRSQRMGAAANRATTLPAGSARNAIKNQRNKNNKKNQKKPSTWGGRGKTMGTTQKRAIGSHAPIDTLIV